MMLFFFAKRAIFQQSKKTNEFKLNQKMGLRLS